MENERKNLAMELNLKDHCIETELKKMYNRYVFQCLKVSSHTDQPGYSVLEERVEILKSALERFDFLRLRNRYPELAGKYEGKVELNADGDGAPYIFLKDSMIFG